MSVLKVDILDVGHPVQGVKTVDFGVGDIQVDQVGKTADREQVLQVVATGEVKVGHVDDFVKLLCRRFTFEMHLLREDGFPIDGKVIPPQLECFGIVDDQGKGVFFAEFASLVDIDRGVVAINLAQPAVTLERREVSDGGIASIQLFEVFHLTKRFQIIDGRSRYFEALQ